MTQFEPTEGEFTIAPDEVVDEPVEARPQVVLAVKKGKKDEGFVLYADGKPFDEGDGTILTRNSVVEVVHDAKILFGPEAVVDESAALS